MHVNASILIWLEEGCSILPAISYSYRQKYSQLLLPIILSHRSIDPMSDDGWGRSAPIIYSSTISMDDDSWDGWGRREPRGDDAEVCVLWILDICIEFSSSMDVCV